jgi:hypothetical protein
MTPFPQVVRSQYTCGYAVRVVARSEQQAVLIDVARVIGPAFSRLCTEI